MSVNSGIPRTTDSQERLRVLLAEDDHEMRELIAILLRREGYENVHGMDERFELYCEDIDLCYRVHAAGFSIHYLPEAVVIHDHLAETDKAFLTRRTLSHYKSMLRYAWGHGVELI